MTASETLNEGLKRAFDLVIAAEVITGKVDKAIREVAPQVRMPGFRPGKVPGNLIRKMHGEALRRDATQEAVNEAVSQLLAERNFRPATQPQVDVHDDSGADIRLSVNFEILPEVPETNIEGIELERLTVEAGDDELEAALQRLAESQKSFADAAATHKAKAGDLVVMDYVGTMHGKPFEGGSGEGMEVEIGSGRLIPGFEDGLLGAASGAQRTVSLTFPEDYPAKNLAGKDAEFAVTVHQVRKPKKVKVDDELAKNLGLDDLSGLRDVLRDQVEAELNGLTRTYMKRKLLDHLAAEHHFEVPPSMVAAEFQQIWQQVEETATDEEKAEMEAERDEYNRIAERRVRLGLLLSDIGQKNGVQVSQAEMNRLVAQEAARFPGQEREVQKYFAENPVAAAQLRAPLFEEKVVDFLLGKASIAERKVSRAELETAIESDDETPIATHHDHGHHHDHDHDHHHDHAAKPAKKKAGPAKKPAAGKKAAAKDVTGPAKKKAPAAEAAPEKPAAEAAAKQPAAKKPAAPKKPAASRKTATRKDAATE